MMHLEEIFPNEEGNIPAGFHTSGEVYRLEHQDGLVDADQLLVLADPLKATYFMAIDANLTHVLIQFYKDRRNTIRAYKSNSAKYIRDCFGIVHSASSNEGFSSII